jgi:hypothetical protein
MPHSNSQLTEHSLRSKQTSLARSTPLPSALWGELRRRCAVQAATGLLVDAGCGRCASPKMGTAKTQWNLHVSRRTAKAHDANAHSQAHKVDKCFQQEMGESESSLGPAFRLVQPLSDSFNTARDTGDGSWSNRPCLDIGRLGGITIGGLEE